MLESLSPHVRLYAAADRIHQALRSWFFRVSLRMLRYAGSSQSSRMFVRLYLCTLWLIASSKACVIVFYSGA